MRRWIVIPLLPMLVACTGPAATQVAPVPAPTAQVAAATPAAPKPAAEKPAATVPTATPKAEAKPEPAANAGPKATIAPPEQNGGIQFGQPLKVGPNSVAVMATNTTDEPKTFKFKIEYTQGPATVTLTGTMYELLPKQSRAMSLVSAKLLPSSPDSITVAFDQPRPAEPKYLDMAKIAVGEPVQREGSTTYVVEVTNNASGSRVIGLFSAYMKGDEMVAYGEESMTPLKVGESRKATMRPVTRVPAYDRVVVGVRNIV